MLFFKALQLILLSIVLLGLSVVTSLNIGTQVQSFIMGNKISGVGKVTDSNLTELLASTVHAYDDTFTQAQHYLSSLEKAPTCHRAAAQDLVESCKISTEIEQDDVFVQQLVTLYAARSAICEVSEASSAIPKSCSRLFISNPASLPESEIGTSAWARRTDKLYGLPDCLSALEAKSQHWTSYSNNRQQSKYVCRAARAQIEQEQLVKLHRKLLVNAEKANDALVNQVKDIAFRSDEQKAFLQSVEVLQMGVRQNLEAMNYETKTRMESMGQLFEQLMQRANRDVDDAVHLVIDQVTSLGETISDVNKTTFTINSMVGFIESTIRSAHEQAALIGTQAKTITTEVATQFRGELDQSLVPIMNSWAGFAGSIIDFANRHLEKQQKLDETLNQTSDLMEQQQAHLKEIHSHQTARAQSINELQEQAHIGLKFVQSQIDDVALVASLLQKLSDPMYKFIGIGVPGCLLLLFWMLGLCSPGAVLRWCCAYIIVAVGWQYSDGLGITGLVKMVLRTENDKYSIIYNTVVVTGLFITCVVAFVSLDRFCTGYHRELNFRRLVRKVKQEQASIQLAASKRIPYLLIAKPPGSDDERDMLARKRRGGSAPL